MATDFVATTASGAQYLREGNRLTIKPSRGPVFTMHNLFELKVIDRSTLERLLDIGEANPTDLPEVGKSIYAVDLDGTWRLSTPVVELATPEGVKL